jgi:Ca2+-binding EF-hand superfamily protein
MTKSSQLTGMTLIAAMALMTAGGAALAHGQNGDGQKPRADFAALDANGDGNLTLGELTSARTARFNKNDTDGDGLLSKDELTAAMSSARQNHADRIIKRLDKNDDGMLSEAEMKRQRGPSAQKMFDHMDANGDGQISKTEFDAAQKQMNERRQAHRDNDAGSDHD